MFFIVDGGGVFGFWIGVLVMFLIFREKYIKFLSFLGIVKRFLDILVVSFWIECRSDNFVKVGFFCVGYWF